MRTNATRSDHFRIDDMARAGYLYAQAGGRGITPRFEDDLDLAAFNAGISNFNLGNNTAIPNLPCVITRHWDGTNRGQSSDKELAIVGA